jgi:hypothetical protein
VTTNPISDHAIAYVRGQATAVMTTTCQIFSREVPEAYDEETLVYTAAGLAQMVYEGVCRIWEVANSSSVIVGDTDVYQQTTNLSIPWDTTAVIKRYDEVIIVDEPNDPQMAGRRYEIQTVAKAGAMRATRRFEVTGIM